MRVFASLSLGLAILAAQPLAAHATPFEDAVMDELNRVLNPLGFQIKSYRVDPEIVAGG